MAQQFKYTLPVAETQWKFPAAGEVAFTWDYDARSEDLLRLYAKGKQEQWDAEARIDWSLPVDPEDPMQMDDQVVPLFGTPIWHKLSGKQRTELRYHSQVFNLSQFLHGEQGALVCAARIVQDVPRIESKFYAATQVMDEARHVEAYRRLLSEKFRFAYPISRPLKTLLEQALGDPRWDFTYLGMQVLIEGLALVAFQRIRDYSKNTLCRQVNAYVMQDEARHVAFGRLALRDYYPELTDAERREREEFVIEGSYHLRDRFNSPEMWDRLGFDAKEVLQTLQNAEGQIRFRKRLFSRIVPTVRDIGLWSERVQKAYTELGGIQYASTNAQEMLDHDAKVAEEFDRKMREGFAVAPK
ncbi:MAG: ferritin-like domain-containing protein [Betaproteobacteria bacterium]|nr:ferritin-like domain-containing protein [Betaproteobacteria bacterium]